MKSFADLSPISEACGESPELVQIVICLPDAVEALTGDSRIKHITFVSSSFNLQIRTLH